MNDKNIKGIKNTLQQNAAQNKADKEQIKNLEEKLKLNGKLEDSEKELLELAKERNAEYERLEKLLKNHNKELSRSAITLGDTDEYQGSITTAFGKGTKLAGVMTKQLQQAKLFQQAISSEISNQNSGIDESGKKQLANISEAYGTMQESILNANKLKSKGLISDKEANKMIEEAAEKYADAAANVDNIS